MLYFCIYFPWYVRFCLATVGAMYFSVRGFDCALFILWGIKMRLFQKEGNNTTYFPIFLKGVIVMKKTIMLLLVFSVLLTLLGCDEPKSSKVDYNKFGFINSYGENIWIEVRDCDFENNRVMVWSYGYADGRELADFDIKVIHDTYYQRCTIDSDELLAIGSNKITVGDLGSTKSYSLNPLSDDAAEVDSHQGRFVVTIQERLVSNDNKKVCLELDGESGGKFSGTYVPATLLDFSTFERGEVDIPDEYETRYKSYIYFR